MTTQSRLNRVSINRIDFSILVPALALVSVSLLVLYSIDISLFRQQLIFAVASLLAYLIFLNIDYRIFAFYAKFLYGISIVLLISVFALGQEIRGAVRWIDIYGVKLQFGELIKPFFIIFFAQFVTSHKSTLANFTVALLLLAPLVVLLLRQPDLGNATIYTLTFLLIFIMNGLPLLYLFFLGIAFSLPFPLFFRFLHDYQRQRILAFLNKSADPLGSSYNAIQALISIGSGGVLGKEFGESTQSILRFLPERQTDFIFAAVSESMGFIGSIFLILLYSFLLFRIYRVARSVDERFSYLVVVGIFFLLLVHVFFNIGMNIGILPIVGITLPFLSYGGSSMLTNFIALGIVSSISFEFRKKHSIEIK